MMKNILWSLVFSLAAIPAIGQIQLTGKISDSRTDTALDNAAIYFPDLKRGSVTDSTGAFRFGNLPRGKFSAVVKYIGYAAQTFSINLQIDTSVNIKLDETVAELSDVMVTGVSRATQLRESPVSVSVMSEKKLEQSAAANLVDAISRQPGVSQITTGAAVSKPVIRGLGYNRVVVLNDGFRQEGQQWGDEHGVEIDELSVEKAEIIKGPGSLVYGSDAIAGVINFLQPEHTAEGKISGSAIIHYQSNNNLLSASLMNHGNVNGFNWLIRGSTKHAGGYENKYDGKVFNTGFNEWNGNAMFGITKRWGFTKVSFSSFNQQIGFNEGERDSIGKFLRETVVNDSVYLRTVSSGESGGYKIFVPNQRVNHHRVSSQSNIIIGHSNLAMNFSWQLNQRREFGNVMSPREANIFFSMNSFTYDFQYHLPEMKNWNTAFGISGMYQRSENKGAEFIIPGYQLFDYGFFAITQRRFGRLYFEAGMRFDQRFLQSGSLYLNTNGEPVNENDSTAFLKFSRVKTNFFNASGSAGISYSFSKYWLLKLNFAKGFRAPNMAELSSNGVHEGSIRYEYGNRNLKPESNYQADAGVSFNSDHVNLDLSLFANYIRNFIFIAKLSSANGGDSIPDPDDPVSAYGYKQGHAILTGGEFLIDAHPHPLDWLHFENSVGYVYAQNLSESGSARFLPFIPPARIRSELRGEWQKPDKMFRNVFIEMNLEYYFTQKNVLRQNNTETSTPGYPLLGASLGFDVYVKGKTKVLSFVFAAQNLLNKTYQSHLSRLKYAPVNPATGRQGIWNAGRNLSVKLIVPFEFTLTQ